MALDDKWQAAAEIYARCIDNGIVLSEAVNLLP